MKDFVHLHAHSHYSLLTALGSPAAMAARAAELKMSAVAITDFGNMHGAAEFYDACGKQNITPILGYDAFLAPRSRLDKESVDAHASQIILLAKEKTGYQNLLRLATEANLNGLFYRPRIDWDILTKYRDGLLCLSGGREGEIAQSILKNETEEKTREKLQKYIDLFGEDFYLEIQRHMSTRGDFFPAEKKIIAYSKELNIPLVATNDAHYLSPEDANAQDILLCIRDNAQRNDPHRQKMLGDDFSLKSPAEMRELFSDVPEACDNTLLVAQKCDVRLSFGKYLLPVFPVPPETTVPDFLLHKCEEGIQKKYDFAPKNPENEAQKSIVDRLHFELQIINQMEFPSYFLIVWDFVKWAKDHDIAVGPGRGSAAGSLVSYCLGVTNIDPLKYGLLFERFLNPERVSMPDIDIDFADDRRDEVVEYVRQKYGEDQVAQICTFGTMAARAAIKDVGRVLGLSFVEMNQFVKLIPEKPGITLDEAFETAPDLQKALKENERFREDWDLAKRIEGGVRHVSVHACAVVISPDSLSNHTALQSAPKDENTIITQFSAKPIDKLGLLKMDFLGLKNLTILVRALKIIHERHGVRIDIDTIPLDEKKAYSLLTKGQTTGVFQLESPGMRRYLKELKPTNLEDIIAMVSLYRPGPMEWIPDYISGKHGKKKVKYPHKDLEPVLKTTFGIAIYQEQILKIAQVFAGFSLGEADLLRRAIGKKIATELAAQREKFIEGGMEKGHSKTLAIKIFDEVIEPFAGYGFNKSHAAGYAMIAYQTAYLKALYTTEFMAALLASDRDNTDRVVIDIEECREMGIEVLPPSVNESGSNFTVVGSNKIRFGLGAIKGVGNTVVDGIVAARGGEPFKSLADFAVRCPSKILNKKSLEALAKAGALSELSESTEILKHFRLLSDFSKSSDKGGQNDLQDSLFANIDDTLDELILPKVSPASDAEKAYWEREVLGLFVSGHPLRNAQKVFLEHGTLIAHISEKKDAKVTVGGILMNLRKIVTKSKKNMAILQIEDPTGKIEVAIFPGVYEKVTDTLVERNDVVFWVSGKVEFRNGKYQIVGEDIRLQNIEKIMHETPDGFERLEKGGPIQIVLKNGLQKHDMEKVHEILEQFEGEYPAEIHALGKVFPVSKGVNPCERFYKKLSLFADVRR